LVDAADDGDCLLGLVSGAECRGADEAAGAVKAAERVAAVVRVVGHAGHRRGMHRLEKEGAETADDHRCIAVDFPRGALGSEQPGIVLHRDTPLLEFGRARQHAADSAGEL
jgi:hypothetical protein